jgi:predicted amidohydrolase YtcJ
MTVRATFHWHNDRSVHHLLDVLERINRETPVASLRWSIALLNDASPDNLARMKAMGIGWLMQNAFYFRGEAFVGQRGAEAARLAPPIVTAMRLGLTIGGGTDAHRVMSYNPFVSLQWMLDGKTVGGMPMRGPQEIPTREQALHLYTLGSAWFSFDEDRRCSPWSVAASSMRPDPIRCCRTRGDRLTAPLSATRNTSSNASALLCQWMRIGRLCKRNSPTAPP